MMGQGLFLKPDPSSSHKWRRVALFHAETTRPDSNSCEDVSLEGEKKRKLWKGKGAVIQNVRKKL